MMGGSQKTPPKAWFFFFSIGIFFVSASVMRACASIPTTKGIIMGNLQKGLSRRGFLAGAATLGLSAGAVAVMGGCSPASAKDAASKEVAEAAGTGKASGKNGDVVVRAVLVGDELIDLELVESRETIGVGETAQEMLKSLIIEHQTLDVDMVSGATLSSMAYVSAVKGALEAAGQDVREWQKRDHAALTREEEIPAEVDVVVIGSGGAGLSAAITAQGAGKSVLVLEKLDTVGGNSALSGAGYAAPGTWLQRRKGVEDSPSLMAQDMLAGGDNLGDPALVQTLCEGALDALEWMTYETGVSWGSACGQDGGHSVARTVQPIGYGAAVMVRMAARAKKLGVVVATGVTVDEIVRDASGAVSGVKATDNITGEQYSIASSSVVIASGGFGANVEMRMKHDPRLTDEYGCTDAVGTTGDGIAMAQAIGAGVAGMEHIQTHPTGSTTTGNMLAMGSIRSKGFAFMVNKAGHRFVEELERRDVVCEAELTQEDGCGYFIFSKADGLASGIYDRAADELGGMKGDGTYVEGDTLEAVCDHFGVDVAGVKETIDIWNRDCESGVDSQFNYRSPMKPFGDAPYAMFSVTPIVHYTMGGVTINADAAVLDEAGEPIPGLFAAGEVTGGIMGSNRLGTTSYVDIIVYGRIAGASAAK